MGRFPKKFPKKLHRKLAPQGFLKKVLYKPGYFLRLCLHGIAKTHCFERVFGGQHLECFLEKVVHDETSFRRIVLLPMNFASSCSSRFSFEFLA